jgi:putative toxin-antitoxin system antitoxin component (TIGR02293 family)
LLNNLEFRQKCIIFGLMSYKKKPSEEFIVNEPMVAYVTQGSGNPFAGLLSGVKPIDLSNDFNVLQLTRQGLPKRVLLSLAKKISITLQELANIMHISERTLQRYDDDEIVKTEYAEKAISLARLYVRGDEVFESMDNFKIWMKTPSIIFNGESPLSLLDTSIGFDMVLTELGRIEHGILA